MEIILNCSWDFKCANVRFSKLYSIIITTHYVFKYLQSITKTHNRENKISFAHTIVKFNFTDELRCFVHHCFSPFAEPRGEHKGTHFTKKGLWKVSQNLEHFVLKKWLCSRHILTTCKKTFFRVSKFVKPCHFFFII